MVTISYFQNFINIRFLCGGLIKQKRAKFLFSELTSHLIGVTKANPLLWLFLSIVYNLRAPILSF